MALSLAVGKAEERREIRRSYRCDVGWTSDAASVSRYNRVYQLGDKIEGDIIVTTKGGLSHNGLVLTSLGQVTMQLSANSVGLFEAFSSSLKPATLMQTNIELLKPGKLGDGVSTVPFSFEMKPATSNR